MSDSRVLVVEDEPFLALDIAAIVGDVIGTTPRVVDTVQEARDAVHAGEVELALLDISLPDGTTFEVADYLLQRGTPYLFVTALNRVTIPLRHRAVPVVAKPFAESELRAAVLSALADVRRQPR